MNEKFFVLPEEKQIRIINSGFRVFANNSYKKSPVGEIAAEAGISKSLLFHYFKNKKELYLFLWEKCAELTIRSLKESGCYEPEDMFEAMLLGMQAKINIMRQYPDVGRFAIKAYYEKDPEVREEIAGYIQKSAAFQVEGMKKWFDPKMFVPGLDLKMMYRDMYLASEGLIWEKLQQENIDVDQIEREFRKLIEFWKSIYIRKGTEDECN